MTVLLYVLCRALAYTILVLLIVPIAGFVHAHFEALMKTSLATDFALTLQVFVLFAIFVIAQLSATRLYSDITKHGGHGESQRDPADIVSDVLK